MRKIIIGIIFILALSFDCQGQQRNIVTVDASSLGIHKVVSGAIPSTVSQGFDPGFLVTNIPFGAAVQIVVQNTGGVSVTSMGFNFRAVNDLATFQSNVNFSFPQIGCMYTPSGNAFPPLVAIATGTAALPSNQEFVATCTPAGHTAIFFEILGGPWAGATTIDVTVATYLSPPFLATLNVPTSVGGQSVQGTIAPGTISQQTLPPVLVGGIDNSGGNNVLRDMAVDSLGDVMIGNVDTGQDLTGNANLAKASNLGGRQLEVAPSVFNGASWDRLNYCKSHASITALAAATQQIVAQSGSTTIRICTASISNTNATGTTVSIVEGTGANCATAQTTMLAPMSIGPNTQANATEFFSFGNLPATMQTGTAGDAVCVTSSAAGSVNVTLTFSQY